MEDSEIKWLDRDTVRLPHITLCVSESEFLKVVDFCGVQNPCIWLNSDQQLAQVHRWETERGLVCVVCLNPSAPEVDPISMACLLVHESVHIFQRLCDYIGEEKPSREFEAYSIERISEVLMREYVRKGCHALV